MAEAADELSTPLGQQTVGRTRRFRLPFTAMQALAVLDGVGLARPGGCGDEDVDPRVNARGGALALGHPWGASGTVAVLQAVQRLDRKSVV